MDLSPPPFWGGDARYILTPFRPFIRSASCGRFSAERPEAGRPETAKPEERKCRPWSLFSALFSPRFLRV